MIESEPRVHPPPIVYRRTTSEVVFCAQLLVYICATLPLHSCGCDGKRHTESIVRLHNVVGEKCGV